MKIALALADLPAVLHYDTRGSGCTLQRFAQTGTQIAVISVRPQPTFVLMIYDVCQQSVSL